MSKKLQKEDIDDTFEEEDDEIGTGIEEDYEDEDEDDDDINDADDIEVEDDMDDDLEDYTIEQDNIYDIKDDTDITDDIEILTHVYSIDKEKSNVIRTTPYLTKYEMVKALAIRVQMLNKHAPPTVPASFFEDNKYPMDTEDIALMELRSHRLPLMIKRPLPNGESVIIPISELLINIKL
uniref:DNA-directed RNA polymerase n=1 Tax=viral metagenome TaxID=1070528 RepID=A0A6C0J8I6_9ZZZZ